MSLRRLPPEPAFRRYVVGCAASTLGNAFATVALAFAVLEATGSVAAVGLVMAASRLPLAVLVLAGGVAADRLSRRRVLIATDLVRAAVQVVVALLLAFGVARLWELLVLAAIAGGAQAFFGPASAGMTPRLVAPERLQAANATVDGTSTACGLGGMLVGGALVAAVGPALAYGLDSATFLVSAIALAGLAIGDESVARPAGSLVTDLRAGWREFVAREWLWVGVVHISLLNALALSGFFVLGPVVSAQELGGAAAWGFIGAAFAAGMLCGSAVAVRWRPRRPLFAAFAGILLAAPELLLLAWAAPTALIAGAAALGGAQASFWGAVWLSTMQRELPDEVLSRVVSYGSLGSLVLVPIGFAAVGPLAEAYGTSAVLTAGAVWLVASTIVVCSLPAIRGLRDRAVSTAGD